MQPKIYWIETQTAGRVGISSRPRGGDWLGDDISMLRREQVDVLVSLLTEAEEFELGLLDEGDLCMIHQIEFLTFPFSDNHVPALDPETSAFMQTLANRLGAGKNIVMHGRVGSGRSALVAASVLAVQGVTVDDAFALIEMARGRPVPDTNEQRIWVKQFADIYDRIQSTRRELTPIEDLAKLWDTPNLVDYARLHDSQVDMTIDLERRHQVSLRPSLAQSLMREASRRDIDVEHLINLWLAEKLQETAN